MLRDVRDANIRATLWGREYSAPIGVAPMGLCNLVAHGTDAALAKAAADAGIPYTLSTAAMTPIETIAATPRRNLWFQLHVTSEEKITFDLARRAEEAGVEVLLVTLMSRFGQARARFHQRVVATHAPDPPHRREPRNAPGVAYRQSSPRRPPIRNVAGLLPGTWRLHVACVTAKLLTTGLLDWTTIEQLRERWRGKLILKGILHPEDAVRTASIGVGGITPAKRASATTSCCVPS
jgi:L-lactate dehydrogenase (cytochrome)/(S)-mandelate dehydrogenase